MQSDPIGIQDSLNTYAYVDSNPLSDIDPFGLGKGIGASGAERYSGKYCGSGWNFTLVPDSFRGSVSFSGACKNHDNCYGICGMSKSECDSNFLADMFAACSKSGLGTRMTGACYVQARRYFKEVERFGGGAYRDAQARCNCKRL